MDGTSINGGSKIDIPEDYKQLRSPIKWVGGKYKLRNKIIELIPPHSCYVEVFGGAGWVLFGKPPSSVEIFNDIDQELITFWRIIRTRPEEFMRSFDLELVSRAEFDRLKDLDPTTLDPMERAHRFYYLIMAGWGGELDYPRFQTSRSDGGHGNRLIGAMGSLDERIRPIHERLKTVIIENLSWEACVKRYDDVNTVMYLDPPYPDNNCNYRHNMRSIAEHEALRDWMMTAKSKLILTNYDKPEIRELYKDFNRVSVDFASGMNYGNGERRNKELIITNFDIDKREHEIGLSRWA